MKKVIWQNNLSGLNGIGIFETEQLALEWIENTKHEFGIGEFWSHTILEGVETRLITNIDHETLEEIVCTEYLHPAEYTFEIVDDFTQELQSLYDQMTKDVLDQMTTVYGTSLPESAQAYQATWELMIQKPTMFVGKLGFVTEAQVIGYAQNKVAQSELYAVYRMERIEQFRQDRNALI